tara:strand:- start:62 stop:169 length:108 start_codon:yes stop_codon:yes gene_type:complete
VLKVPQELKVQQALRELQEPKVPQALKVLLVHMVF